MVFGTLFPHLQRRVLRSNPITWSQLEPVLTQQEHITPIAARLCNLALAVEVWREEEEEEEEDSSDRI